jgi:hypothetical protein
MGHCFKGVRKWCWCFKTTHFKDCIVAQSLANAGYSGSVDGTSMFLQRRGLCVCVVLILLQNKNLMTKIPLPTPTTPQPSAKPMQLM